MAVGALALLGMVYGSASAQPVRPASAGAVRVANCTGPALSLPDSLARRLPPRTGRMRPDDQWADLASSVPGGFAGVLYDSAHTPVLMLTRPELANAAIAALTGKVAFPFTPAAVRQARWDFAQLVDWFNYLFPRLAVSQVTADKDEALNRIRFSVTSIEARDRVVRALAAFDVPCDLVVVDLNGLTVRLSDRPQE